MNVVRKEADYPNTNERKNIPMISQIKATESSDK
jgi:hypothetical protein